MHELHKILFGHLSYYFLQTHICNYFQFYYIGIMSEPYEDSLIYCTKTKFKNIKLYKKPKKEILPYRLDTQKHPMSPLVQTIHTVSPIIQV